MNELPLEVWQQISELVTKSDQSRFRQASPIFRSRPPSRQLCCSNPTNSEIATYLMSPEISSEMVKKGITDFFVFLSNGTNLHIYNGPNDTYQSVSGILYSARSVNLSSKMDVLRFMEGTTLDLEHHNSWKVIRNVYHQRTVCKLAGINPDECFIEFVANNLPDILTSLRRLNEIVKFPVYNRLSKEFLTEFPENLIFAFSPFGEQREKQVAWLRIQLRKLKPSDLTRL